MTTSARAHETSRRTATRWTLGVVAVIGIALVVMPFAFNMFTKTPDGAVMIAGFKPYMTTARLDGYQTDLRQINAAVHETDTSVASYLGGGTGNRKAFAAAYPEF